MRSPLGANRRDLSAILLTIMVRAKQAAKMKLTPAQSFLTPPKRRAMSSTPRDITPSTTESLRAPNISPKNGNFDFSVGNFSSSGSSASSTSFDNSCSLTVLKARVVTDSSRAAEMKKQLFSNGAWLNDFADGVAGGVADVGREANEEDGNGDEGGSGGDEGAAPAKAGGAVIAVITHHRLNNHAGNRAAEPN
nr:hypothetical protein TEA_019755 [Ipomoea batatas]